jgi:DNA-binding response OmpR family regulator
MLGHLVARRRDVHRQPRPPIEAPVLGKHLILLDPVLEGVDQPHDRIVAPLEERRRWIGLSRHRPNLAMGRRPGRDRSLGTRFCHVSRVDVLVVEDEAAIADFIERGLEAEGHRVMTAADGEEGRRLALGDSVDLVILDRMLPKRDGMEVLDAIRAAKPDLPVIVLTAMAEVGDRVEGLDRGATDYLTKPFAFEELAARVRARLREPRSETPSTLEAGGIRLDLLTRRAERGSMSTRLPDREAELLAYLMRRPGQVCTQAEILGAVWGYDHDPGTNVVPVYIGYLRRRLALPESPAPIETVRSAGYRLVAD